MVTPVVITGPVDLVLQKITQPHGFAKVLKKTQAAKTSQASLSDEKLKSSRANWHTPQYYLKSRFVE
jgi:hypothetical protein